MGGSRDIQLVQRHGTMEYVLNRRGLKSYTLQYYLYTHPTSQPKHPLQIRRGQHLFTHHQLLESRTVGLYTIENCRQSTRKHSSHTITQEKLLFPASTIYIMVLFPDFFNEGRTWKGLKSWEHILTHFSISLLCLLSPAALQMVRSVLREDGGHVTAGWG